MTKQVRRALPTRGNVGKALNYAWGLRRIDEAIKDGYFIEAVAIEESIMSDRLWSRLYDGKEWKPGSTTLGKLLGRLKDGEMPPELLQDLKRWNKDRRNWIVHTVAKATPTKAPKPIPEFLLEALDAAEEGKTLVRKVLKWHKKELAAHRRAQKASG